MRLIRNAIWNKVPMTTYTVGARKIIIIGFVLLINDCGKTRNAYKGI